MPEVEGEHQKEYLNMPKKTMPKSGMDAKKLLSEMEKRKAQDVDWKHGRMFSLIYNAGPEIEEVGQKAFSLYIMENGLGPFAFPSLKNFENETIAMVASMLGGDEKAAGNLTSGGSESILMSVKAARDYYRDKHPEITQPELVMPDTAHPGWDKAGHYLGIKSVHYPVNDEFEADLDALKKVITPNTIMMIASAPTYPHGVVDPIDEMGKIAQEKNIWLHVDACLGGFILPFVNKITKNIPPFDLSVPGVNSISADIHKYGFAPKGVSTVIYRNANLRRYQFFATADWPGGVYATTAVAGARNGGAIAAAWAIINHLGEEGYLKLSRQALEAAERLKQGVNKIEHLKVLGNPKATIFAIGSDKLNIFEFAERMKTRHWYLENQHLPPSIHITVSPYHAKLVDEFLGDLKDTAAEVAKLDAKDVSQMAAMYGMIGNMPDRKTAKEMALNFLSDIYKL